VVFLVTSFTVSWYNGINRNTRSEMASLKNGDLKNKDWLKFISRVETLRMSTLRIVALRIMNSRMVTFTNSGSKNENVKDGNFKNKDFNDNESKDGDFRNSVSNIQDLKMETSKSDR
jgi:hypothetical protein